MKSTILQLNKSNISVVGSPPKTTITIPVPLTRAYAIEYFTLQFSTGDWRRDGGDILKDGKLSFIYDSNNGNYDFLDNAYLTIFHHGIRNYSLLFPNITDKLLADRLGEFYKESERCFEESAWLSFSLMCGAVFEGLLYSKINTNEGFAKLIEKSAKKKFIDSHTEKIMKTVKEYRNLVHANRMKTSYVTRESAFDIRTTMDEVIKSFAK